MTGPRCPIVGADLTQLVGRNGEVLEALQELTRLAVYRETGERSRLMLDIVGLPRRAARARWSQLAEDAIAEVQGVRRAGVAGADDAFERKVVHDAVAAAGLTSESEGVEPRALRRDPPGVTDDGHVFHVKQPSAPRRVGRGRVFRVRPAARWPSGTPSCWRPTASSAA